MPLFAAVAAGERDAVAAAVRRSALVAAALVHCCGPLPLGECLAAAAAAGAFGSRRIHVVAADGLPQARAAVQRAAAAAAAAGPPGEPLASGGGAAAAWFLVYGGGPQSPPHCIVGFEIARGARFAPGDDAASSPTGLPPRLALLTLNLARVRAGDVVADPCCGGGALCAAAEARCGAALALGADAAPPAPRGGPLRRQQRCAMDLRAPALRGAPLLDAMVVDTPFGRRAPILWRAAAADGPDGGSCDILPGVPPSWSSLARALLALAGRALVPGGRLACWVPRPGDGGGDLGALAAWLDREAAAAGLQLRHLLPEARAGGTPRALTVLRRCGQRQERRGAGAAAAAASGRPNDDALICGGGAHLQRHIGYAASRAALSGAAADVWRAAWWGDAAAVAAYLDAGGPPDAPDAKGQTPLAFAAGYGREPVLRLLLAAGADPGACAGLSAAVRAAARGHIGCLAALAAGGAPLRGALHAAARFGHLAAVRALLQLAPDQLQTILADHESAPGAAGGTPLHAAARWGHAQVAEALLAAGASAAAPDRDGATAAALAARWGHAPVLAALGAHGADLADGGAGETPLGEARHWGRPACVAFLQGALQRRT
jgi:SAM-dependent methyltransferase